MKAIDNIICLLVGASGSGKTTITEKLKKEAGFKIVESYTTRPKRYEDEAGHIFVSEEDYEAMKDDMCAFTVFDGHKYWATNKQVDESDIYIIDPAGIEYFRKTYKGSKEPFVIYLKSGKKTRKKRMLDRGDNRKTVQKRLQHDKKAFANAEAEANHIINADVQIDEVISAVYMAVKMSDMLRGKMKNGKA